MSLVWSCNVWDKRSQPCAFERGLFLGFASVVICPWWSFYQPVKSVVLCGWTNGVGALLVDAVLTSSLVSGLAWRMTFGGHLDMLLNQSRPFCNISLSTTFPRWLSRSAGLWSVGAWCHSRRSCSWIFFTRLKTSWRYSLWSLIQYKATVES